MDVLNTTGGGAIAALIVLAIPIFLVACYAFYSAYEAYINGMPGFSVIFVFLGLVALMIGALAVGIKEPIRYEVTLRPGHVIDATKYDVIEQRGSIYVIREREVTQEEVSE